MSRSLKIGAALVAATTLVVVLGLVGLYQASRHVPEFYRDATALDAASQATAREQFIAQVTGLASDLHGSSRWQRLFTDRQINAWLAVDLANEYPELSNGTLREPRISLGSNEATIACRYDDGAISAVLSVSIDAYLEEPNVLALRIHRARAGLVPVPLGQVLDRISQAARELKLQLEWRKAGGDPVALITFGEPGGSSSEHVELSAVELRAGELFVAGAARAGRQVVEADTTDEPPPETTAEAESVDEDQVLVGSAPKETRQE